MSWTQSPLTRSGKSFARRYPTLAPRSCPATTKRAPGPIKLSTSVTMSAATALLECAEWEPSGDATLRDWP